MEICSIEDCTGCTACYSICPQSAISLRENEMGFLYPIVDEVQCVNCGLCQKVCPNNTQVSRSVNQQAFVAKAKSVEEQRTSTSGGLASVLSRYIIRQGGVVYGCTGEDCANVHHIRISSEEEIALIKGSKYVQSSLGLCFRSIKKDLQQGTTVLFVGTPCQCAGLRSYLQKDYDNLYVVDFVCHGVPSQKILGDAIRYNLKSDDLNGIKVQFRYRKGDKEHSVYGLQLIKDNKSVYQKDWPNNEYITGFLCGVFYRESCYTCKYASPDRVSDITLGDFWDRKKERNISKDALGLSSVICNSYKGNVLLSCINSEFVEESIDLNVFVQNNGQLRKPFPKPNSNGSFKKVYVIQGYEKAVRIIRKEIRKTKKNIWINSVSDILKKRL